MRSKRPFKCYRFPAAIILCAVRMYLRYPPSYQDVADLFAERGLDVASSAVFRWLQKFGPGLSKRTEKHLGRASLNWQVDETYLRVGGSSHRCRQRLPGSEWRYLWRAIDADGRLVDFKLTARRDAKVTLRGMETIRTIKNGILTAHHRVFEARLLS